MTPEHQRIAEWVGDAIAQTSVLDLHTHLYPSRFGPAFCLWGIDELLTYHYLIAETLRAEPRVPYEQYHALPKAKQAELIWRTLFIERAPLSEACRGVLSVLHRLGLPVWREMKDLQRYRDFFAQQKPADYVDRVFKVANVRQVVMTNDALDPAERAIWLEKPEIDPRFKAVLRIDPVLLGWPDVAGALASAGYRASGDLGSDSMAEIRRFLDEWIDRMKAIYVAVSLPPTWRYPDDSPVTRVIDEAIAPVCRERNLPFALMIGVTRRVNPKLQMAGDAAGKADITSLQRLLARYPQNKFMVTMLSRENQHELAVTARKFRNLFLFGCWWFLNNPSLIDEITRMRIELLGTSFTPQHSDTRVLDQIIYKWDHSRSAIEPVLVEKFADLAASGWPVTPEEIRRTVEGYFDTNFSNFLAATIA